MTGGKGCVENNDGARRILRIIWKRGAPGAVDEIYQEVAKFMNSKRTDQSMDVSLTEFDVSREEEARVVIGGGFPDGCVSIRCAQNAARSKNERPPVLASRHNTLAPPEVSSQMRRLFGPRGNAARRGVLLAADSDTASGEEDFTALVAYRKAKKAKREGG